MSVNAEGMTVEEDVVFDLKVDRQAVPDGRLHVLACNLRFLKASSLLGDAMVASGRSCCPLQGTLDALDEMMPGRTKQDEK